MSDSVIAAFIAGGFLNLSVLLPILLSTQRHVKNTANQTKNGHSTNMRDDIDVLIVAQHRMHEALGIDDTFVRERYQLIKARQKESE